jgi:hypothetical protein
MVGLDGLVIGFGGEEGVGLGFEYVCFGEFLLYILDVDSLRQRSDGTLTRGKEDKR